jgi:hypothetical protein
MALDAAQIRLCSPPAACSSCYGQYPQRRHVDFGASWDGRAHNDALAKAVQSKPASPSRGSQRG